MLTVYLLCALYASPVWSKVYLDIDSPTWQKYKIAVPDFSNSNGKKGTAENPGAQLAEHLSGLFRITAFLNVIDKKAYLEPQQPDAGNVAFADWLAIGAEYLVQGRFQQQGSEFILDCRLYDVVKGEAIIAKKYRGKAVEAKAMLRRFAGEVLVALTGEGDIFNTRLAFVMKKGKAVDILSINYDGTDFFREKEGKNILMSPRWSPDGRYLSFTSFEQGNPDVYIKDMLSNTFSKISSFPGINLAGGWSPDGKTVLLTLSKDGNEEIYKLDYTSRSLQQLTTTYSIDVSPTWSPDGNKIAFVSNRAGNPQIYIMDADGNNVRRLTWEGNYNTSPVWSPKGDRIAYESRVNGGFQICTIGTDGDGLKQLTTDGSENKNPTWSPDGRYLAFSKSSEGRKKIYIMTATGGNVRLLYEGSGDCVSPAWSPRFKP